MKARLITLLALGLAACAEPPTQAPQPATPVQPAPGIASPAAAARSEGAIDATQVPAATAARLASLRRALQAVPAGLVRVEQGSDGNVRVSLSADAAFDTDSALLKPAALLPLSLVATEMQRDRGSVTHLIGFDADRGLAERRAQSVRSVLLEDGAATGRLRSESRPPRVSAERRVEIIFVPLVLGREAVAWMPPAER